MGKTTKKGGLFGWFGADKDGDSESSMFNKFMTQLAIDAGLGMRLDFKFFIFKSS